MTAQSNRKIVVVNTEAMMNDPLYRSMKNVGASKVQAMLESIEKIASERRAFEANRERKRADGSVWTGQSADIRHVDDLVGNEAFARMCVALKIDPRAYLFPQSKDGGKTDAETSNLKAYRKARQVAECIWNGSTDLEGVARIFTVCAYRAATMRGELIEREFAETFLSSVEFRTIAQGSEDLWTAIDEVRAKHMTTGAQTQASQMIRTLVALKSAVDERNGRAKNVRVNPEGKVLQGLMRRFGQVTDTAPETAPEGNAELAA